MEEGQVHAVEHGPVKEHEDDNICLNNLRSELRSGGRIYRRLLFILDFLDRLDSRRILTLCDAYP